MNMGFQRDNKKAKNLFIKIANATKYSFDGLKYAYKYEQSLLLHLLGLAVTIALGIWLKINIVEWAVCAFAMGLILGIELINTSIEATVDLCSPEIHPLAKIAKDTASAAVFIIVIISSIAELVIFIPKIVELLR